MEEINGPNLIFHGDNLPVLRKIRTLPNIVKQSDPFNVK